MTGLRVTTGLSEFWGLLQEHAELERLHRFRDAVIAARALSWYDERDAAIDDALRELGVEVDDDG